MGTASVDYSIDSCGTNEAKHATIHWWVPTEHTHKCVHLQVCLVYGLLPIHWCVSNAALITSERKVQTKQRVCSWSSAVIRQGFPLD